MRNIVFGASVLMLIVNQVSASSANLFDFKPEKTMKSNLEQTSPVP